MGLARLEGGIDHSSHSLTEAGSVVGTPDYIAPEQARNAKDVDIRADLYSLGCTLYFLLVGHSPFSANTLAAKLLQHQLDEAQPLEELRRDVPVVLSAVVRKLMAKRPEERLQTPAEAAAALEPFAVVRAACATLLSDSSSVIPLVPLAAHAAPPNTAGPDSIFPTVVECPPRRGRGAVPGHWLLVGGAIAAALLLGIATWVLWPGPPPNGGVAGNPPITSRPPITSSPASRPPVRPDPEVAKVYLTSGRRHLDAKRYDQAIADLTRAIEFDPQSSDAYFFRAAAYFHKRDYGKALADNGEVVRLRPRYCIPYYNRGIIHQINGDPDRAIAEFSEAIQINPRYTTALFARGSSYLDKHQYELAMRDFDTGLKLDDKDAGAYNNRGLVHYRQKNYASARADFDRAIELNPKYANAYYNRSLCHERMGNQAEARADLQKARELDPNVTKRR
jgi:tetratricopeptide (TPR) repeat protein